METNLGVQAKKKKKPGSKTNTWFIVSCITIPLIHFLLFYIYSNGSAITMAFQDSKGAWSFDNFKMFFKEFQMESSDINLAFRNTAIIFAVNVIQFPFQVLVSYFLYKKIPLSGAFRILFFLPSVIFDVCVAEAFTAMIGVEGPIALWVQDILGLAQTPELLADSRYALATVLTHKIWLSFAGDLIIWGGTFARIPQEVLEAGKVDGATWWDEFTKITLPMIWPTFALKVVLMFCGFFNASGGEFLLTSGGYKTITVSTWLIVTLQARSGGNYHSGAYNYMSAVGIIITIIAVLIAQIIRRITDRMQETVEY